MLYVASRPITVLPHETYSILYYCTLTQNINLCVSAVEF